MLKTESGLFPRMAKFGMRFVHPCSTSERSTRLVGLQSWRLTSMNPLHFSFSFSSSSAPALIGLFCHLSFLPRPLPRDFCSLRETVLSQNGCIGRDCLSSLWIDCAVSLCEVTFYSECVRYLPIWAYISTKSRPLLWWYNPIELARAYR